MSTLALQTIPVSPMMKPYNEPFDVRGYPRIARMMGRSDDLSIFRRSHDLYMLDLQAEFQVLRDILYTQWEKDGRAGKKFSISMQTLRASEHASDS